MFQFGFNMFPDITRPFSASYRCHSVAMLRGNEREDVERGGKIIMPPSALEQLTRLNINYPMLFKLINRKTSRTSHCGVLEFVADEGKIFLPFWMMRNMMLEEGDSIQVESVSLPVGTFSKFQPLSPDFLDITNPKAVLENCLRWFACLTTGDVIAVQYNQRIYELCVLETKPGDAISIIECDMNVEFAAPVGYNEQQASRKGADEENEPIEEAVSFIPEAEGFVAFCGSGNRLDGKIPKNVSPSSGQASKRRLCSTSEEESNRLRSDGLGGSVASTDVQSSAGPSTRPSYTRGIPDYDYTVGTIKFIRFAKKCGAEKDANAASEDSFKAFSGRGKALK